ncbi:hypothetical protein ACG2LH_17055 [Zhouia sp. PK063]|uniref:hypothetical protein n=1 Tax=Zhouia sp. PK063 TaxID=3373602 RepID=UPI0037AFB6A9
MQLKFIYQYQPRLLKSPRLDHIYIVATFQNHEDKITLFSYPKQGALPYRLKKQIRLIAKTFTKRFKRKFQIQSIGCTKSIHT